MLNRTHKHSDHFAYSYYFCLVLCMSVYVCIVCVENFCYGKRFHCWYCEKWVYISMRSAISTYIRTEKASVTIQIYTLFSIRPSNPVASTFDVRLNHGKCFLFHFLHIYTFWYLLLFVYVCLNASFFLSSFFTFFMSRYWLSRRIAGKSECTHSCDPWCDIARILFFSISRSPLPCSVVYSKKVFPCICYKL